jgi:hypothetical protein
MEEVAGVDEAGDDLGDVEVPDGVDAPADADRLPAVDEAAGLPLPSTLAGEETSAEPGADEPGSAEGCTVTLLVTVSPEPPPADEQAPVSRATESAATTTNFGVRERTSDHFLRRSVLGDSWRRPASGADCPAPSAWTRCAGGGCYRRPGPDRRGSPRPSYLDT